MAASAYYQRKTGPSYPAMGIIEINNNVVSYKLIRTYDGEDNAKIKIEIPGETIFGKIKFKRYKSLDEWTETEMIRDGNHLIACLPHLPPAGKVMYQITLDDGNKSVTLTDKPVILRYKGHVPDFVLIPHIIIIFIAMMFSTRAGFEVIFNGDKVLLYSKWTVILLTIGGMILGPVVQKYAFDSFWTGWPFGQDMTDNKTLVAFIFWIIALFIIWKNPQKKGWALVASLILFIVYLIPHSMFGSEIDFTQQ